MSTVCVHFARGTCRFGSVCYKSHDIAYHDASSSSTETSWRTRRRRSSLSESLSPLSSPRFSSFSATSSQHLPCRYFIHGTCLKGDACLFSHSPTPESPTPKDVNSLPSSAIPRSLSCFEQRFYYHSSTFRRVLSAKSNFGRDPHVSAHFDKKRDEYKHQTDATRLAFRNQFEQAFGEFSDKVCGGNVLSNDKIGTFLDLGCAPGGFSKFILDNNQGAVGMGITLPDGVGLPVFIQGTCLEDGLRYRMEFGDLTMMDFDSIRTMYPLPSGTAADEGYDLVIAGAFATTQCTTHPKRATLALTQLYAILSNLRPGGSAVMVANTKPFLWLVEMFRVLRQVFGSVEAVKGDKLHAIRSSTYLVCRGFLSPMSSGEGDVDVPKLREQVMKAMEYVRTITEGRDHRDITAKEGEELESPTRTYDVEWYSKPVIFAPEGPDALFDSEHRFILDMMDPLWEAQIDAISEMSRKHSAYQKGSGSFRGSFSRPSNNGWVDGNANEITISGSDKTNWRN